MLVAFVPVPIATELVPLEIISSLEVEYPRAVEPVPCALHRFPKAIDDLPDAVQSFPKATAY